LYGSETWPLTSGENTDLRVFENRVLRIIFGRDKNGLTRGWRKLQNDELYNLYSSPDIFRGSNQGGWAGHVARMGEMKNEYRILLNLK
jgi:hypothetical protein